MALLSSLPYCIESLIVLLKHHLLLGVINYALLLLVQLFYVPLHSLHHDSVDGRSCLPIRVVRPLRLQMIMLVVVASVDVMAACSKFACFLLGCCLTNFREVEKVVAKVIVRDHLCVLSFLGRRCHSPYRCHVLIV